MGRPPIVRKARERGFLPPHTREWGVWVRAEVVEPVVAAGRGGGGAYGVPALDVTGRERGIGARLLAPEEGAEGRDAEAYVRCECLDRRPQDHSVQRADPGFGRAGCVS